MFTVEERSVIVIASSHGTSYGQVREDFTRKFRKDVQQIVDCGYPAPISCLLADARCGSRLERIVPDVVARLPERSPSLSQDRPIIDTPDVSINHKEDPVPCICSGRFGATFLHGARCARSLWAISRAGDGRKSTSRVQGSTDQFISRFSATCPKLGPEKIGRPCNSLNLPGDLYEERNLRVIRSTVRDAPF
ncbi:hypothetical protein J6590_013222 [Homalodisca vitripennis]|nr:hypothetical protein J6590_013222 [Homalodisca vitripennis]